MAVGVERVEVARRRRPPVSGSAVARRARDRHAARHRLEHDEPEALVERRVHEHVGAAHQRVEALRRRRSRAVSTAAGQRRRARRVSPASTSRCSEPSRAARHASTSRLEVLLRAQVADRRAGRARRPAAGADPDRQRRRVGHDADRARVDAVAPHTSSGREVARRRSRARPTRAAARRERSGTSPPVLRREVLAGEPRRRGRGSSRRRGTAGAAAGSSWARGRASAPLAPQRARQRHLLNHSLGPAPRRARSDPRRRDRGGRSAAQQLARVAPPARAAAATKASRASRATVDTTRDSLWPR